MEDEDEGLPEDHPLVELWWRIVPLWHGASTQNELDTQLGEGYSCGFSVGYRRGIITAMLRPEWAQGFYHMLRQHYLTTDFESWEADADETTWAIPIHRLSVDRPPDAGGASHPSDNPLQGFLPSAAPIGVEETM